MGRSSSIPSEPLFGPRDQLRETFKESQTDKRTLKTNIRGEPAEHLTHASSEAQLHLAAPDMWKESGERWGTSRGVITTCAPASPLPMS